LKKNKLNIQDFATQFFVIYDFLNQQFFENNTIIVKVAKAVGHVN
jgi:hypothetical protein